VWERFRSFLGFVRKRHIDELGARVEDLSGQLAEQKTRIEELAAETEQLGPMSLMQIAPEQGAFMTVLARLIGARAAIQISHRGFRSSPGLSVNTLNVQSIERLIEAFGLAAERAKRAGFELVEIHVEAILGNAYHLPAEQQSPLIIFGF
jgi:predicted O-methyltransferase YrrM